MNQNELSLTIAIPTLNSAETIHIPMKSIVNQKKNKSIKFDTIKSTPREKIRKNLISLLYAIVAALFIRSFFF